MINNILNVDNNRNVNIVKSIYANSIANISLLNNDFSIFQINST